MMSLTELLNLGIDTSEFEQVPAMALGVFDICVKDIVGAIAHLQMKDFT